MTSIINLKDIQTILKKLDVVAAMEDGFKQYSNGKVVVPPVGELIFEEPPGDTHIKYGYIKQDDFYVIKIASGFYENPKIGLSSSQGLMLVFSQKTGQTAAVLLDEGYLTNIRTAAAGVVAAKYFAPKQVKGIGIIGTGIQAELQLQYLQKQIACKQVWIWGRHKENAKRLQAKIGKELEVHIAETPSELARHCNLIVTTTPATSALLQASDIQPGTHITAVGSDTSEKQELAAEILEKADIVIADSLPQSKSRGEVYRAIKANCLDAAKVIELGKSLQDASLQRQNEEQITVVDLTGVAVQDIMIAKAVYLEYKRKQEGC